MPSFRLSDEGVERSPAIAMRCSLPSRPNAFSFLPRSISARCQVAGVLRARFERAEPAFVLAAGRSDAAALVERDGAVGEKGLHASGVDDLHKLVGHGIIIHFFKLQYLPVAS